MPRRRKEPTAKLKATLKNGDIIKALVNFVSNAGGSLELYFDSDGLTSTQRDERHIALYDFNLTDVMFTNYECEGDFHLVVDAKKLKVAMEVSEPGDEIEIRAEGYSNDEVQEPVSFEMEFRNATYHFVLEVTTVNDDTENLPEINEVDRYDCEISLPSASFNRMCRDFTAIDVANTSDLQIKVTRQEGVEFFAGKKTKGYGSMKLLETAAETDIKIRASRNQEATFSLQLLSLFSISASICPKVKINMSKNAPLLVDYDLGEGGYVRFYLAPKLTDLDEMNVFEAED